MNQVLIIDESPLFRDYVREKLTTQKIEVDIALGARDGFAKLISTIPDLLIIDSHLSNYSIMEFLENKAENPNAAHIPVILTGPSIDKELIVKFATYNVYKYFTKPIKIDTFFESIGKIFQTSFPIDTTPCLLENHINDTIIFVEISQGLNREKILLLKYRLSELIEHNRIVTPKIILMITDIELTFIDGPNLEYLLDCIIAHSRIKNENVKILTFDTFTVDLVEGHEEYEGIEVIDNIALAMDSLFRVAESTSIMEFISEKVLSSTGGEDTGTLQTRFHSDMNVIGVPEKTGSTFSVAMVDNDTASTGPLVKLFNQARISAEIFDSGSDFLAAINSRKFDLILIDIFMPGLSGFDILKALREKHYTGTSIVYSRISQREAVVQALALGARTYLIKPLPPEAVVRKSLEILHTSSAAKSL
ncbi:MAG: response regulator [Spirochaetaceae bacterium]|jgi:DNA-binding response OmpR family regulator|nr:response regulator [Spirochaetaceae bacterium]